MADQAVDTVCCIAGGGPAGMMLGYLLARAGVPVTVVEKHKDFFRDFRGDTVHPSTLEIMKELGLLEDFLKIPHQQLTSVGGKFGDFSFEAASFRRLPVHSKFVALMPQWDFLNFLARRALAFRGFDLRMENEVVDLVHEAGRIAGVIVKTPLGEVKIRSKLVIGCDGRHSVTRQAAHLEVREFGVPIDVLWFRVGRSDDDPEQLLGNVNYGQVLILINRGEYFQAGLIIPKGSFDELRREGLDGFRAGIVRIAPFLGDRVGELKDWEQIKLLSVRINRLRQWSKAGLLCIGDAAHAMSPAGGVGINLAIQDAVAAANLLTRPLRQGRAPDSLLAELEKRREFPTRVTQQLQIAAHKGFERIFQNPGPADPPWQLKVAVKLPGVHSLLGRLVGLGVRREHVLTADLFAHSIE